MDVKTTIKYLQFYLKENVTETYDLNWFFLKLVEAVGELSVAIRKNLQQVEGEGIKGTIDEELWSIIFYTLVIANKYDVDMEIAIKDKEEINFIKWNNPTPFEVDTKIVSEVSSLDGNTTIKYLQNYLIANNNHPERLNRFFLKLIEEVGELSVAIRKNLIREKGGNIKGTIDEELREIINNPLNIPNSNENDMEELIEHKEHINLIK